METVITMIILVGAAVIFLSNVFRQARKDREQAERRVNLPRRRDANTERFLEEINRRRQQTGGQAKPPPPVRPATLTPAPKTPLKREPPVRTVVSRPEIPRQDRPPTREATTPAVVRKLLEVIPADKPAFPVPAAPEPPLSARPEASTRPPAPQASRRPLSPILRQLLPLLQSRQSLRAGFVLHEILGPPKCRQGEKVTKALAQGNNQHN